MGRASSQDGTSTSPTPVKPQDGLPHDEIRSQLDRILGHREFQATERLRDFLRFVVAEDLAGRAFRLKGYTIAREVFGRAKSFDATVDPIVRIEAGRLRRALERYYLVAGDRDPIRIDIPKGRYVPRFHRQDVSRTRASDTPVARGDGAPVADGPAIAILPFDNLTADSEQVYFIHGLAEELVAALNRYQDVVAIPCQTTVSVGGGDSRLLDPGKEVCARFLLSGSVRRDAAAAKVTVHLTDSITGTQIWAGSHRFDLDAAKMIATQEDIASDVVAAVAGAYGVVARRLARESHATPPEELSTYEAMLRYHHAMLVQTPEAGEQAFIALQQATQREPEYGPAWSALGNLFAHAYVNDEPGIESPLEVATEYAQRGASLEPNNQLTRAIMAFVYLLRRA